MGCRDVFIQNLADMCHELVHIVVGFVNVVKDVVALRNIVDHELHESHDIANVCHRLLVLAFPYHQELAGRNLLKEIVDITTVSFTEDYRRAYNVDIPVRVRLIPFLEHLLCLPFRLAVMVERISQMVLVGILLVKTINSHRREENDSLDAVLLHSFQRHLHAADISIIIERNGRDIISVLGCKKHHKVITFQFFVHLLLLTHIADYRHIIKKMTWK